MDARITTDLDAETAANIAAAIEASGQTAEEFVSGAVRAAARVAAEHAALVRLAEPGIRDLDDGRWISQDQMMASIRNRPSRGRG
jgi:uncharacterized protein (DUF1778 family)